MVSSISSVYGQQSYQAIRPAAVAPVSNGRDSDGDNDGSKAGEVESANRGVTATVGTRINTSA